MPRILVVEDDIDQLEMRKLILENAGYEVSVAMSASEAMERLPGCQMLLMDLRIPTAEDGLRLIQAAAGSMRIVVLSGAGPSEPLPVDAVLTKPCPARRLLETVARFLLLLVCISALRGATFQVSKQVEVVAEVSLRAPGTDWSVPGNEAALATVLLDGHPQQQIMLYAGGTRFGYNIFLGSLAAGSHRLDVQGDGVEFLGAQFHEDASDVLANAPVVYARANTIGKYTDIPLLLYCERLTVNGERMLQYTLIFSNEDGGTSTRALMARWGRTNDVEYVYRAVLGDDGSVRRATIQAQGHKDVEFHGKRDGSHPLLMPVTDNNMIGEAEVPTPIRYQIAPILVDLSGHSREVVIDEHPIAYRVMSQELKREDKLRPFGTVDGEKVSDPLNYLYVEMKLARSESAIGVVARLRGDPKWYSSYLGHTDYAISTWKRNTAESYSGFVRTTLELPPGTKPEQIEEIGFQCLVPDKTPDAPCRVDAVTKAFFLDSEYRPGPNVWTLTSPREIPAGQIWTSRLK